MARTQHISIADFKAQYPLDYEKFLHSSEDVSSWIDTIVAFDVTFNNGEIVKVFAYDEESEEESKMHEYRKDCRCANCEERRLGVVLEEE